MIFFKSRLSNNNWIMKIACLILAHKNLEQLIHLCRVLTKNNLYVFIHFDKKWNLSKEEIKVVQQISSYVYISEKRFSTYLDHRSLVDATLHLCNLAKKSVSPSYYALLSGQDYPIKSLFLLKEKLCNEYPKPFIDCTPYNKNNWMYYKYKNSSIYNKFLHRLRLSNVFLLKKIERRLHKWRFGNHSLSLFASLNNKGVYLYGGSAWWILPDIAIEEIFLEIESNPKVAQLLLLSFTPEESFFQTMVMRTSINGKIVMNDIYERKQNCLTYANFETPLKPFSGHPHIITSMDWLWLKNRPEYFARKFDITVDREIIEIIDKYL